MTPEEQETKNLVVMATIARIEVDYADLIAEHKGYDGIPIFFRDHLYCPPNKEARDQALDNLYKKLKSVTGPEMTENVNQLIKLNKITDELDLATARTLLEGPLKGKDPRESTVSVEQLREAMLKTRMFEERRKQIGMVGESLTFFFSLSKLPLIKLVMAPIKVAASLVGASELVGTMEAGYDLTRNIKNMQPFLDAFSVRERQFLDELEAAAG